MPFHLRLFYCRNSYGDGEWRDFVIGRHFVSLPTQTLLRRSSLQRAFRLDIVDADELDFRISKDDTKMLFIDYAKNGADKNSMNK